jgi:hypothetical protein
MHETVLRGDVWFLTPMGALAPPTGVREAGAAGLSYAGDRPRPGREVTLSLQFDHGGAGQGLCAVALAT